MCLLAGARELRQIEANPSCDCLRSSRKRERAGSHASAIGRASVFNDSFALDWLARLGLVAVTGGADPRGPAQFVDASQTARDVGPTGRSRVRTIGGHQIS